MVHTQSFIQRTLPGLLIVAGILWTATALADPLPSYILCADTGGAWTECGSGCGPFTCDNPESADFCPAVCIPQCVCPAGEVWNDGPGCIALSECEDIGSGPPLPPGSEDKDGDGWSSAAGDCDDSNPDAYPGAPESCDGIDTSCNGVIDDDDAIGCSSHYYDADDDGWGIGGAVCKCAAEAPFDALQTGDCDDSDDQKYPGNSEKCNNTDDNCNGIVDENKDGGYPGVCDEPDPAWTLCTETGGPWNPCGSGCGPFTCDNPSPPEDGGCPEECVPQCECPETHVWDAALGCIPVEECGGKPFLDSDGDGWSSDDGDCDDSNIDIYPGAPEDCDGLDNNCDGAVDDGCDEPGPEETLCDNTGGDWQVCGVVCGPFTCDNPSPPACADKVCGDDGCGGVCGECPEAAPYCVEGACLDTCAPACDSMECGDNGCGGSCGTCPDDAPVCGSNGLCWAGLACTDFGPGLTKCDDLNPCSFDSCDMETGACVFTPITAEDCDDGELCTVDYCDVLAEGCVLLPNLCDDYNPCTVDSCEAAGCKHVVVDEGCADVCQPDCKGKVCGDNGCGGSCGLCPAGSSCSGQGQCVDCTPNCAGKVCGDDGCGGSCGTCPIGLSCDISGACDCAPQCACPGTQVWDGALGCLPVEDCGGGPAPDDDGDGWSPDEGDCDDSDPNANPGAPEECDGVDNNCDGVVDDGCSEPDPGEALCEDTGGSWEQVPDCAEGDECPSLCVCPADTACWATDTGCHACPEEPPPSEHQALCEESEGVWTDCVSGCGPFTCDAPPPGADDEPPVCGAVCTEGCDCPASHVWDPESGCIPIEDCPPKDEEPPDAPADAGGEGGGGGCTGTNGSGRFPVLVVSLLLLGAAVRRRVRTEVHP